MAAVGAKGLNKKIFFLTMSAFLFTILMDKFVSWIGICIRCFNGNQAQTSNVRGGGTFAQPDFSFFSKTHKTASVGGGDFHIQAYQVHCRSLNTVLGQK